MKSGSERSRRQIPDNDVKRCEKSVRSEAERRTRCVRIQLPLLNVKTTMELRAGCSSPYFYFCMISTCWVELSWTDSIFLSNISFSLSLNVLASPRDFDNHRSPSLGISVLNHTIACPTKSEKSVLLFVPFRNKSCSDRSWLEYSCFVTEGNPDGLQSQQSQLLFVFTIYWTFVSELPCYGL